LTSKILGKDKKQDISKLKYDYDYLSDHYLSLKKVEPKTRVPSDCYSTKKIENNYRTALVNWMIETIITLVLSRDVIQLSIHLLDKFVSKTNESLAGKAFQYYAFTSIYLAAKIVEMKDIRLEVWIERVLFKEIKAYIYMINLAKK
jgi:hypothetical protein